MKKFITVIFGSIVGAILMAFVLSGCSTDNKIAAKNKEVITVISGCSTIAPTIFKDTETGHEYIVFRHGGYITVTPRLSKEEL